jgi:hypothetical protein
LTTSNQLLSPCTVRSIATALVKSAFLHASYGPKNVKLYPPFSLRHKSNWNFSCGLPNFEQNQSSSFFCHFWVNMAARKIKIKNFSQKSPKAGQFGQFSSTGPYSSVSSESRRNPADSRTGWLP